MSIGLISLPIDDVSIGQIQPTSNPLRKDLGDIGSLCDSINKVGLLQPIVIRTIQDHFEVVAGNRRLEACKRLHWRTVPCHVVELTDKEAFEIALVENLERQTLDPLEEAQAFDRYVSQSGWGGMQELSRKIGRSSSYISKRIKLLSLPTEILDQIFRRRKNSVSLAEEILSLQPKDQLDICRTLEKSPMSSRGVRRLVKAINEADSIRAKTSGEEEQGLLWNEQLERQRLVAKCIDQTTVALRLALMRLDAVLDKLDKEWVEKEILLQYRFTLHGQIDSLIRLRKKLLS